MPQRAPLFAALCNRPMFRVKSRRLPMLAVSILCWACISREYRLSLPRAARDPFLLIDGFLAVCCCSSAFSSFIAPLMEAATAMPSMIVRHIRHPTVRFSQIPGPFGQGRPKDFLQSRAADDLEGFRSDAVTWAAIWPISVTRGLPDRERGRVESSAGFRKRACAIFPRSECGRGRGSDRHRWRAVRGRQRGSSIS